MRKTTQQEAFNLYEDLGFFMDGEFYSVDRPVRCIFKDGYVYNYSLTNLRTSVKNSKKFPNHTFSSRNPYCIENILYYMSNNNISGSKLVDTTPVKDNEKYTFICGICGNVFAQEFKTYRNFNPYKCCQKCARKFANYGESLNPDDIKKEYYLYGYDMLEEYRGVHYPHLVKNICTGEVGQLSVCALRDTNVVKHKFEIGVSTDTFHEELFTDFLIKNNIKYIKQYLLKDCQYERALRVDFYLEELNIAVEIDGDTHLFDYRKQVTRDSVKEKYLADNNVLLVRISNEDIANGNITDKLHVK